MVGQFRPRATSSGEAGVVDYKGRWNMQELVRTFLLPTLSRRTAVGVSPEGRRKLVVMGVVGEMVGGGFEPGTSWICSQHACVVIRWRKHNG